MGLHYQLVLQIKSKTFSRYKLKGVKYLNAGDGYPWAGQINAIPADESRFTLESIVENLGIVLPMGSRFIRKQQILRCWSNQFTNSVLLLGWWVVLKNKSSKHYSILLLLTNFNLNEGWGNPWAGHTKAMIWFSCLESRFSWESSDIWGLLPPMGSE